MTNLIVILLLFCLSLAYTLKPKWFLGRKYLYEEIPVTTIRSARVVGVILCILFAVLAVCSIYYLITR